MRAHGQGRLTAGPATLVVLAALALGGCTDDVAPPGPKEREAASSSSGATASPAPTTPTAAPSTPGQGAAPTTPGPGASGEVSLVIAAGELTPVVWALIEQFESGWERDLGDHPWTVASEDLFDRIGEAAGAARPGDDLQIAATPAEVGALLATLDREAEFFAIAGMDEAEAYAAAAAHVREQLTPDVAAEVEHWLTDPRAAWDTDPA